MRYANGNNLQNSFLAFENRRYYDTSIVPISKEEVDIESANNTFIDIFINKPYYGRIDHQSDGVITAIDKPQNKSSSITALPFNEKKFLKKFRIKEDIYAMNFVVDAFEDMAFYFNRSCQLGSFLSREGPLSLITPEVGWVSASEVYENHIKNIYNLFTKYYNEHEFSFKITNFNDFLKTFIRFLDRNKDNFSILYSSYCMSRYVSPNISGLIVEIAIDDHSDDYIKTSKYLSNRNYEFFKECAKRYGFFVDRNVPWRLIANISSSNLLPYMKKYGLEKMEDVFSKQYIKTYKYDLFLLRETIARTYNSFVTTYPTYKTITLNDCNEEVVENNRSSLNFEEFYNNYPLEKFLNLYLKLRSNIVRESLSDTRLQQLQLQVKQIFLSSGIDHAVMHINNTFNGFSSTLMKKEFFTPKTFDVISTDSGEKE